MGYGMRGGDFLIVAVGKLVCSFFEGWVERRE